MEGGLWLWLFSLPLKCTLGDAVVTALKPRFKTRSSRGTREINHGCAPLARHLSIIEFVNVDFVSGIRFNRRSHSSSDEGDQSREYLHSVILLHPSSSSSVSITVVDESDD